MNLTIAAARFGAVPMPQAKSARWAARFCADDQAGPRSSASGRRPAIGACLLRLVDRHDRHDRIDGRDLHRAHLPLDSSPQHGAGAGTEGA